MQGDGGSTSGEYTVAVTVVPGSAQRLSFHFAALRTPCRGSSE